MSMCSCCNFTRPELLALADRVKTATDATVTNNNRITFYAPDGTAVAGDMCPWTAMVLLQAGGDEELARVLVQAGEA